jgi:hypothetical protein
MSIFDVYDQEYSTLCKEISKNISELRSYTPEGNSTAY